MTLVFDHEIQQPVLKQNIHRVFIWKQANPTEMIWPGWIMT
jgi:hypothetical protein